MKIMFCINTLTGGGAERVVSVIASALAEIQNEEVYIALEKREINEYEVDERVHVEVFDQIKERGKLRNKIGRIINKRKMFRKYSPNIIIPFLPTMTEECIIAAKMEKIPVISTIRVNPAISPEGKLRRKLRDLFIGVSDMCWVQTESQRIYFKEGLQQKIFVLPNPVSDSIMDIKREHSENIRKFVSLGRLNKQKNYPMEIKAFSKLVNEYPDLRLDVYGNGGERDKLNALIKKLNMQKYIGIHDRTDDVKSVYMSADAFILASDFEGMPNALMEAMAAGLPCISTDCPTGPSDVIGKSGECGILIPVRNEEKLVDAIRYLLEQPSVAAQMGKAAHDTINNRFSSKKIAEELLNKCEDLVGLQNEI